MTRRSNEHLLFLGVGIAVLTQYPAEFSLVLTVLLLAFENSLLLAFQQVVLPIIHNIVAGIFFAPIILRGLDIAWEQAFALLVNDWSGRETMIQTKESISSSGFDEPSPPELNRPAEGETNWHEPLNENFGRIDNSFRGWHPG